MPYQLITFIDVALPEAMPEDDLSTGVVDSSLQESIGGIYDLYGPARRLPRRQQFKHVGKYEAIPAATRITSDGRTRVTSDGRERVTAPSLLADLAAKSDALKARIGQRGQLFRKRLQDGQLTWKLCRLLAVAHQENVANASVVTVVESTYETMDTGWRSASSVIVSAAFSAVGGILNVQNGGTLPVVDATLSIHALSGPITAVYISGPGIDLTWTGTLAAAATLALDAGAQTLLLDGADAYSGLVWGAGHTQSDWLPLPVGQSNLIVSAVGGSGIATLEFFSQVA